MTSRLDELLDRAKGGSLPRRELDATVAALRAADAESIDTYTLLHIVGRAGGPDLREDVEPFLDAPEDPMLARLALQILVRWWGLGDDFRSKLLQFLDGVPWDDDDDVRMMAVTLAGDHLARHPDDQEVRRRLDALTHDPDDVVAEAAVDALARRPLGLEGPAITEDLPPTT